ncbi:MAG: branched-chain amino acid ABC transporter permease [Halodesulfurarchaeum sp.]
MQAIDRGRRFVVANPFAGLLAGIAILLLADLIWSLFMGTLPFSRLATYTWDGLVVGLVIGLASVGLSMTYSILNFANFAHGDYITAGAFMGWSVTFLVAGVFRNQPIDGLLLVGAGGEVYASDLGINVLQTPLAVVLGLIAAIGATILVVLAIDRIAFRPLREEEGIILLITSVGVALALRYSIVFIYQQSTRSVTANVPSVAVPMIDGTLNVTIHQITLVVVAAILMLGVHVFLQSTKLGKAMRAMADNKDLARVTGIPTERVVRWTWIIGGGLTGAAGYLIALERGTLSFNLGWLLLLLIFAAVILGGIGSIYGAIAGGIVIGLASRVSLIWLPEATFARPVAFLVMIFLLVYRPQGIFGGRTTA